MASASAPITRDIPLPGNPAVSDRDTPAQSLGHEPSRLRIELSAVAGARIGDGQTGIGLGALSFLDLSGWLVGFEGRADGYQKLGGHFSDGADTATLRSGALELAVLGGRRFRFRSIALDFLAGPAAAFQGTTTFESHSPGRKVSRSSSSTVPRLLLGTRVNFSARSTLHTFVALEGELGPSRAGDDLPGAPRLPVWTLGLALGATVGTQ